VVSKQQPTSPAVAVFTLGDSTAANAPARASRMLVARAA
jgi:hypothetical protein